MSHWTVTGITGSSLPAETKAGIRGISRELSQVPSCAMRASLRSLGLKLVLPTYETTAFQALL